MTKAANGRNVDRMTPQQAARDGEGDIVLLSAQEAARRLSLSPWTVYQLIKSGDLRSKAIGRRRMVPVSALAEFTDAADAGGAEQ